MVKTLIVLLARTSLKDILIPKSGFVLFVAALMSITITFTNLGMANLGGNVKNVEKPSHHQVMDLEYL
jgi:hypothetical protein